jgi:hypothetical protein
MTFMKKLVLQVTGVSALCMLMGLATKPLFDTPARPQNVSNEIYALDGKFYPLIIRNPASNDTLRRLIDSIDASGGKIDKKFVFQFVYQNGKFTLKVNGMRKNHRNFDSTLQFILETYDKCLKFELDAKSVYLLGDQEINKQDGQLKKLRKICRDPLTKFVVFMPMLQPLAGTAQQLIKYEIYVRDKEADICSESFSGNTGIITNPSPPHGGN